MIFVANKNEEQRNSQMVKDSRVETSARKTRRHW
jgi:hypothetical protein